VEGRRRRVLIIVENLPLGRDARVQRECRALLEAGYGVSVICPQGDRTEVPDDLAAVRLHQYPRPRERASVAGYVYEYLWSWLCTAALSTCVWRQEGFDIMQACNPPDTYFPLGAVFKMLGRPFVFDHHDLAPELYTARFGRRRGLVMTILLVLERATFSTADHVVATNQSFEHVAHTRGRRRPGSVTIVRNGPELARVGPVPPRPELKHGRRFLACWAGVMGAVDDGVDLALEAIHILVRSMGRTDCHFTFIGHGEAFDDMGAMAGRLGVAEFVTFTGWLPHESVFAHLSSADLGLQPDPKNPRTDLATATKTMEYMAFGLPIVAFDVVETRASAHDAAAYATPNSVAAYADLISELLDDPARRAAMGRSGRRRVEQELAWDHQKRRYVGVFDDLLGERGVRPST